MGQSVKVYLRKWEILKERRISHEEMKETMLWADMARPEVGHSLAVLSNRKEASAGKYSKRHETWDKAKDPGYILLADGDWTFAILHLLTFKVMGLENWPWFLEHSNPTSTRSNHCFATVSL